MAERHLRRLIRACEEIENPIIASNAIIGRRKAIEKIGSFIGVVTGATKIVRAVQTSTERSRLAGEFESHYPKLPEETRTNAGKYELHQLLQQGRANIDLEVEEFGVDGDKIINDLFDLSGGPGLEDLKRDHEQFMQWKARLGDDISKHFGSNNFPRDMAIGFGALVGVPFLLALGVDRVEYYYKLNPNEQSHLSKRFQFDRLVSMVNTVMPEWLEFTPSRNELEEFITIARYLPPVGGKVQRFKKSGQEEGTMHTLTPSLSAEEIVDQTENKHHERYPAYVQQLAVQGRLPDQFKYAALALILHNPYPTNWEEPFFTAHWGNIGPLVHDGGVHNGINKLWQHSSVSGRTDFLERIFLNRDEENPQAADANRRECERMLIEARFYQRAALALHAHLGTAPESIPAEMRERLAALWVFFENRMKLLLQEYMIGAANIVWFLDKPVKVPGWNGWRRETEGGLKAKALNELEKVKAENPGILQEKSKELMIRISNEVDHIIGLDEFLNAA